MNFRTFLLATALLFAFYHSVAQKSVAGLQFSACLNKKELPHDFYKGKFLVLDFWATWCGPCIGSFPRLDAMQKKYHDNSKVVFATLTTESLGHIDTFFHRRKDILPGVYHLTDHHAASWQYFDICFIPHSLVFNPAGKIVFSGSPLELERNIDKLLKGTNMMEKTLAPQPAVENKLEKQMKAASFIAMTGPADSSMQPGGSTNSSNTGDEITIRQSNISLKDIVAEVAGISGPRVTTNDSTQAQQQIFLYYRQVKNCFPEYDKGMFTHQYQNHLIDFLGKMYSLHCEWITERATACKIIVKDSVLLRKAATISNHGSYGSSYGTKYTFVNQPLKGIADEAEDALNMLFFTEATDGRYDLEVDFTSLEAFEKSLSTYGLTIEKTDNYMVKKLMLTFK